MEEQCSDHSNACNAGMKENRRAMAHRRGAAAAQPNNCWTAA